MEWRADISFGPDAESARCPVCGTVWGVRARRKGAFPRPPAHPAAVADKGHLQRAAGNPPPT